MKKTTAVLAALALVMTACSGGTSTCEAIVDDGMGLFQDAIDELAGISLVDLNNGDVDPFASADYEERTADLERRTTEAGCTDEEMTEFFSAKVGSLEAGDSNPAGEFFISILTAAVENGEFNFRG